jgi:hypothetical protein
VTVLDDLRVVEERIATRLAELEPLVQEYNELQEIAARLNIDLAAAAAAAPAPVAKAAPKAKAKAKAKPKGKAKPKPKAAAKQKAAPKPAAAKPKPAAEAKPVATATATKAKPATKRRAAKGAAVRRQPGGTQKAGAERRERMLALIGERPGITVPELSEVLSVDAPSLYRVVRKLQSDGTIAKDGKALRLTAAPATSAP